MQLSTNNRARLKAELDRASHESALRQEKIRIKDARGARIEPHRRRAASHAASITFGQHERMRLSPYFAMSAADRARIRAKRRPSGLTAAVGYRRSHDAAIRR